MKLEKGAMRPLKKILGVILGIAGIGIIFFPDNIVPVLCNNKIIFGIIMIISAYFLIIAGRRYK